MADLAGSTNKLLITHLSRVETYDARIHTMHVQACAFRYFTTDCSKPVCNLRTHTSSSEIGVLHDACYVLQTRGVWIKALRCELFFCKKPLLSVCIL